MVFFEVKGTFSGHCEASCFSFDCSALCWFHAHVFPLVLCTVIKKKELSSVLSVTSPTSQLVCDLLCAENKFLLNSHRLHICHICLHQSPSSLSSFHTFALHTFQLVSMTSGLSTWRTNLAFHSGSTRKVFFFLFVFSFNITFICCFLKLVFCDHPDRKYFGLNIQFDLLIPLF